MTTKIKPLCQVRKDSPEAKERPSMLATSMTHFPVFLSKGTYSFILHWDLQITELVLPPGLCTLRGKKAKEEFFTSQHPNSPSGSQVNIPAWSQTSRDQPWRGKGRNTPIAGIIRTHSACK